MKINKFNVAIYNWTVTLIQIEDISDVIKYKYKIIKAAKNNFLSEDQILELLSDCNDIKESADFFSLTSAHKVLIVLYKHKNYNEFINSVCHEKRHLEDYILEKADIYDKEAAGYLAGYLASKIFPLLISRKIIK